MQAHASAAALREKHACLEVYLRRQQMMMDTMLNMSVIQSHMNNVMSVGAIAPRKQRDPGHTALLRALAKRSGLAPEDAWDGRVACGHTLHMAGGLGGATHFGGRRPSGVPHAGHSRLGGQTMLSQRMPSVGHPLVAHQRRASVAHVHVRRQSSAALPHPAAAAAGAHTHRSRSSGRMSRTVSHSLSGHSRAGSVRPGSMSAAPPSRHTATPVAMPSELDGPEITLCAAVPQAVSSSEADSEPRTPSLGRSAHLGHSDRPRTICSSSLMSLASAPSGSSSGLMQQTPRSAAGVPQRHASMPGALPPHLSPQHTSGARAPPPHLAGMPCGPSSYVAFPQPPRMPGVQYRSPGQRRS